MVRAFITGANRGLGLEFTRQFLTRGERVYAATRRPESAAELQQLKAENNSLSIIPLDVSDQKSIKSAVQFVESRESGLDLLINNAGIYMPARALKYSG